eukprot:2431512-Rhodomonas_salina.1
MSGTELGPRGRHYRRLAGGHAAVELGAQERGGRQQAQFENGEQQLRRRKRRASPLDAESAPRRARALGGATCKVCRVVTLPGPRGGGRWPT